MTYYLEINFFFVCTHGCSRASKLSDFIYNSIQKIIKSSDLKYMKISIFIFVSEIF
jgi:hypothetical protein